VYVSKTHGKRLKCSNIASEELRKRIYLPTFFDFEVTATRDITETISLLARMSRFRCGRHHGGQEYPGADLWVRSLSTLSAQGASQGLRRCEHFP